MANLATTLHNIKVQFFFSKFTTEVRTQRTVVVSCLQKVKRYAMRRQLRFGAKAGGQVTKVEIRPKNLAEGEKSHIFFRRNSL